MKPRILCLEDDQTIQTLIEVSLPEFEIIAAFSIKEAERRLNEAEYSALLIDIRLPDGDGLRFLTTLSADERFKKIPILVLSDHSEISNKVMAFSFGAEDFIGKPFDPIELNARVTAKIKRRESEKADNQIRKHGNLLIDFGRQKAFLVAATKEKDLGLTSIELKILTTLTKRLEQVYSREQIMDLVWGDTSITDRTVDSHVAHLRQKIQATTLSVETAKSFGYRAVLKK